MPRPWSTVLTLAAAATLSLSSPALPASAIPAPPDRSTSAGNPVDLDVLFVGAHPDDEASGLSTYGLWNEQADVTTGVVTVTRGEGGGNAVGPEEGPDLGLIREREERRAVARAGVSDVFNLDEVDFYYTVSAPLTQQVWGHRETLSKVVRLVRETRPEVVVTMDPAPSPGNHGNHQEAARLAIEAFHAAADPDAFPDQLSGEGLRPWRADRLFTRGARGTAASGPDCAARFTPTDATQDVYGVWGGYASTRHGTSWAQVERVAQREYASQGWAVFPDAPTDPQAIGCDYFTQVASRVPYPAPGSAAAHAPTAMLDGALTPAPGGLPLGTELSLDVDPFAAVPGQPVQVAVHVRAGREALGSASVALDVPAGWTLSGDDDLGRVRRGRAAATTFTVTPPADAATSVRQRLSATLTSEAGTGYTAGQVAVSPEVSGTQQPLPQVAEYQRWTDGADVPALDGIVPLVLTVPSGGSRTVGIEVTNHGDAPHAGTVSVDLPPGFATPTPSRPFTSLAPGESTTVAFDVENTDATLPMSEQGGDYAYTVTTTTESGRTGRTRPALELVPATTVTQSGGAPTVDGVVGAGEYDGTELDLSRRWEGEACASAGDCSATGHVTWQGDALYVAVQVTDDRLGTRLSADDCKRHWRTDSVEIALDPRGRSENTSTTFKAAILPVTEQGGPCFLRDADNHQGPGPRTAPGMQVASQVTSPYSGYTVEARIPFDDLPGSVEPAGLGLNLLVYDSDTQDKTGQTRLGWSTWRGVQGDPYRWGVARLAGHVTPAPPEDAPAPVIPDVALSSLDSPLSVAQAVRDDVPLAGGQAAGPDQRAWVRRARATADAVRVDLTATGPGTAHVFVRDRDGTVVAGQVTEVSGPGRPRLSIPVQGSVRRGDVLVAFAAEQGGTLSSRAPVH